MAHLDFVTEQLKRPDTWRTSLHALVEWWLAREQLRVVDDGVALRIVNDGPQRVAGAVVVVERAASTQHVSLPPLNPGDAVTLADEAADLPFEWSTCSRLSQ